MKMILTAYGIPTKTVNAIMMLYQNTRSMVRSPDGDTQLVDITTGIGYIKKIRFPFPHHNVWILYCGKHLIMDLGLSIENERAVDILKCL